MPPPWLPAAMANEVTFARIVQPMLITTGWTPDHVRDDVRMRQRLYSHVCLVPNTGTSPVLSEIEGAA